MKAHVFARACIYVILTLFLQDINAVMTKSRCPTLRLVNGRVRVRSRGRIARFNCFREYQLVGEKYATCIQDQWDIPIPICVKAGCPPIPALEHGIVLESYRGAVIKVICNPGYNIKGNATIYCMGVDWNSTVPVCEAGYSAPELACDFESEDLCGWTQDPHHDFDWRRQSGPTPSGHVGTGPSYDHTLGPGLDGHYMYIESSSPRLENDTARLFSPVFGAQESQDACFSLWYHMYGATTGYLRVYVKPEGVELRRLTPSFKKYGEHGNQWFQGFFDIDRLDTPFQIVVEALRGGGYVSDIAFDDVRLSNGSDCVLSTTTDESSQMTTIILGGGGDEVLDDTQSCRWRCTTSDALTNWSDLALPTTTSQSPTGTPPMVRRSTQVETPVLVTCDCIAGCVDKGTCCQDYAEYCIFARIPSTPKSTTRIMATNRTIIQLSTLPPPSTISSFPDTRLWTVDRTSTILPSLPKSTIAGVKPSTTIKQNVPYPLPPPLPPLPPLPVETVTPATTTHLPEMVFSNQSTKSPEKQTSAMFRSKSSTLSILTMSPTKVFDHVTIAATGTFVRNNSLADRETETNTQLNLSTTLSSTFSPLMGLATEEPIIMSIRLLFPTTSKKPTQITRRILAGTSTASTTVTFDPSKRTTSKAVTWKDPKKPKPPQPLYPVTRLTATTQTVALKTTQPIQQSSVRNLPRSNTTPVPPRNLPRSNTTPVPPRNLPRSNTTPVPPRNLPRSNTTPVPPRNLPRSNTTPVPPRNLPRSKTTPVPPRNLPRRRTTTEKSKNWTAFRDTQSSIALQVRNKPSTFPPSAIIGVVTAAILVILTVLVVTLIVVRRRRRSGRQDYMSEDSDVRFLTSDETLDFTLAKPRERDDLNESDRDSL